MKLSHVLSSSAVLTAFAFAAAAQASSLVSSMGIYAYPAKGQSTEQQSKDDYECYDWAKGQTGYDPVNPPQPDTQTATAQTQEQAPGGERLKGALRGAAAGALIGGVTDNDKSDSAAVGATLGTLRGGRDARQNQEQDAQQQQQAAQQQQQAAQEQSNAQVNQFKSAYGACMSGRGYTVS